MAAGQKKRRRWLRRLLSGLAAVVIFLVVLSNLVRWNLQRQIDAHLDLLREAGFPVTLEEWEAWYETPPEGENAAPVYMDAIAKMNLSFTDQEDYETMPVVGEARLPEPDEPLSPELRDRLTALLDRNREAVDGFIRGARFSGCRFPLDFSRGMGIDYGYLVRMGNGGKLVLLDAVVAADAGNADAAVERITAILALARALSQAPVQNSQMTAMGLQHVACQALEQSASRSRLTREQLVELDWVFGSLDFSQAYRRAAAGSIYPMWCEMRRFGTRPFGVRQLLGDFAGAFIEEMPLGEQLFYAFYRYSGWHELNCLVFLEDSLFETASRIPELMALYEQSALSKGRGTYPSAIANVTWMFSASYWGLDRYLPQTLAAKEVAQTALAVEQFRLDMGRLPGTLDELVPVYLEAVPEDPYSVNQPLLYRQDAGGYVVYSVGRDHQDDGGIKVFQGLGREPVEKDIIFRGPP